MDKQQRCSYRSNTRGLEVNQQHETTQSGPNTKGSSVLALQWTGTDDCLQVCRSSTNKKVEAPITRRKISSLLSSIFDTIGLLDPISVHLRRLRKGVWTKNGQHWDSEVEPGEEAFLRWKQNFPFQFRLKQASTEDTSIRQGIKPNFMYLRTLLKTPSVQWPICIHSQKNTQIT